VLVSRGRGRGMCTGLRAAAGSTAVWCVWWHHSLAQVLALPLEALGSRAGEVHQQRAACRSSAAAAAAA